jgi:hypothetical protein
LLKFLFASVLFVPIALGQTVLTNAQIAKRVSPSVVVIQGKTHSGDVLGSGFVISKDGKTVTNLHVIKDLNTATVQLANAEVFDSISVLAIDERRDLAIVKVAGFDLPALELGNSDALTVGESLVIVGSPRGLEGTVTAGILSSVRDELSSLTRKGQLPASQTRRAVSLKMTARRSGSHSKGEHLYWGIVEPTPPKPHADGDGVWRTIVGGWRSTDLNGEILTKDKLSGALTKLAGFRGTSCSVDVSQYVIRRINGQKTSEVEIALRALNEMKTSVLGLIRLLGPQDFETLVDLVFSTSG